MSKSSALLKEPVMRMHELGVPVSKYYDCTSHSEWCSSAR